MFFIHMTAAVRKRKKQDEAMNIFMQRKATTHGADFLFSLFSFLINGVAPLPLNVQQVDLLAPWGGFCFFPPLGGRRDFPPSSVCG